MTVTEFLKSRVPFLQGLSDEQAALLAKAAEQKLFSQGQTVIFQGVTVDGLHVVAAGKVSVYTRPNKRKEAVHVAELGPGEVFGETSVVESTVAGATIKSAADETLVFVIPEAAFRDMLAEDPSLQERTLALIAARRQDQHPESQEPKP